MSLNALGSLCTQLCEQFTWNCQSNRSHISCCNKSTTYYLGTNLDPSIVNIIQQQNLPEAMKALEQKPIPVQKIKTSVSLAQAIGDHGIEQIRAGMCQKMVELIAKLNNKEEEKGNGQSKLRLAAVISNLQGADKYKKGEPLTEEAYNKLIKAANDVQKYYKGAIFLWKNICNVEFDYTKLEDEILKAPLDYFKKNVSVLSKTNLRGKQSFWQLEKIAQKILLEASMKFKLKALKEIETRPILQEAFKEALTSEDQRKKSDEFPRVLLESQTRHTRDQSYEEKGAHSPRGKDEHSSTPEEVRRQLTIPASPVHHREHSGKLTIPASPVHHREHSGHGEDSPLVVV